MKVQLGIPYDYGTQYFAVEELLNIIIDEFELLIPFGPTLGDKELIVCLATTNVPMTYPGGLPEKYAIGITPNSYYPLQIAYQFAHELCHVFIDPRLTNWLIESFCECMSFIIIERIGSKPTLLNSETERVFWETHYSSYLEETKNDYIKALDLTIDQVLTNDFSERMKSLTTAFDRDSNFINAWKVFDIYKSDPNILHLISVLHFSKYTEFVSPTQLMVDSQPNLSGIETNLPSDLKMVWAKLKLKLSL